MLKSLSHAQRVTLFGHVTFKPHPTKNDPDAVIMPWDWKAKHLREYMVPQLARLGVNHSVTFHYKSGPRMVKLWQAWDDRGYLDAVATWNGSFVTRFKRGSARANEYDLSNHSWGTAFDINARLMPRGTPIAKVPPEFLELVPVAEEFGFAWGGYFGTPDPMHFECVESEHETEQRLNRR